MADSLLLAPSQVLLRHPSSVASNNNSDEDHSDVLVPSQVPGIRGEVNRPTSIHKEEAAVNTSEKDTTTRKKKKSRKKNSKGKKRTKTTGTRLRQHGNIPDVEWRAVPMDHLRLHPNFVPLPLPETIERLERLEDIRNFRQESWQWDAVHDGRCTTSQAVAALGFLEPEAGRILGIPKSWQSGGIGAYERLRQPALRTLEEMNEVLCQHGSDSKNSSYTSDSIAASSIWEPFPPGSNCSFPAKYLVPLDEEAQEGRKQQLKRSLKSPGFDFSIRMKWGNAQEPTSLLTCLNFFAQQSQDVVELHEVGMCGAGIKIENSTLLLGATPDALICHPNGTKEVLEVKNHCPFLLSRTRQNNNNRPQSRFVVQDYGFDQSKLGILPQYVPQLMMEMLCVGPECKSAVMVRQSATSGALIIRVQRDDDWIEEMIYWLKRFLSDYVEPGIPPPQNFFLQSPNKNDEDRRRYQKFLEWTKELESKVMKLAHVPHSKIQRAGDIWTELFLDS
eukprot:scaffold4001_cov94-Cylindrotheca_fusiformis.AAC.5